jgi:hypothetical protein
MLLVEMDELNLDLPEKVFYHSQALAPIVGWVFDL